MSAGELQLRAQAAEDGEGWELFSPGVGYYAQGPAAGSLLQAGDRAGVLVVLECVLALRVPEGVAGMVAEGPPERKHQPVGYGDRLFTLRAAAEIGAATGAAGPAPGSGDPGGKPVVRAPQAGRFWRRPEPGAPEFVSPGDTVQEGRTLGLMEVMKTFNPVKYAPGGGLGAQARVVRFLVEDGAEVEESQPLLELEAE